MRADTIRWRGVMSEDRGDGLDITDLRRFLGDAEELAHDLGTWAGIAVPLVLLNGNGTIRHIWVGVQRRRLLGRSGGAGDVAAGPAGAAAP